MSQTPPHGDHSEQPAPRLLEQFEERVFTAAIFDMDGLLLDSERAIMDAWIQSAREAGVELTKQTYLPVVGRAAPQADAYLAQLLGGREAFVRIRESVLARLNAASAFAPKRGVLKLLSALSRRGVPCAVASSTAISEVRRRLALAGIESHFDALAGGDEVEAGKPSPDVYLLAAQRLRLRAEHCLAFEDSSNGIRAARSAGMAVVAVPDLVSPDTTQAHTVLPSLEDADRLVDHWFPARSAA